MHNSVPICCVCLETSLEYVDFETPFDVGAVTLTGDETTENDGIFTYLDCFRECTRLEADRGFDMSHSFCMSCSLDLKITYDFLQKARKAETILLKAIQKTKSIAEDIRDTNVSPETLKEEKLHGGNSSNGEEEETLFDCEYCTDKYSSQFVLNLHIARRHALNTEGLDVGTVDCGTIELKEITQNEETSQTEITEEEDYIQFGNADSNESEYLEAEIEVTSDETAQTKLQNTSKDQMNMHKRVISYKCSSCPTVNKFSSRSLLMRHQWKMHKPNPTYHCNICNEQIDKSVPFNKHVKNAHTRIVECSECDYKSMEFQIVDHERQAHGKERDYICNICSKSFVCERGLNAHVKYHQRKEHNTKSDACEICGKIFSSQSYLRRHVKTHRDERELFQCEHCNKLYFTKPALDNHMRIHMGNTIECTVCGKLFSRQYELKVHMRFHNRDYNFECEICSKKFAIKGHLRTHMWRHQGLKLQCELCGKLFTSTKALNEHSFSHTEMPFMCNYCPKGFPSRQKYKVHLKTIHQIEVTVEELMKCLNRDPKPLQRKKLTLVQVDSIMKEVEIESKENGDDDSEDVTDEFY